MVHRIILTLIVLKHFVSCCVIINGNQFASAGDVPGSSARNGRCVRCSTNAEFGSPSNTCTCADSECKKVHAAMDPCDECSPKSAPAPGPVEEVVSRTAVGSNCGSGAGALVLYSPKILEPFHLDARTFHLAGRDFSIKQNWADFGVAAVVWDAALVLCEYLEAQNTDGNLTLRGKQVIELGAGTGLVGMVAAALNGETTVTDRESVLEPLRENVKLNFPPVPATSPSKESSSSPLSSSSSSSSSTTKAQSSLSKPAKEEKPSLLQMPAASIQPPTVKVLDWGENLEEFPEPFDIIVGADIVYIEESFPALLKTLLHLSNEETLVLLSCRIRYERDKNFLQMLEDRFNVQHVLFDQERGIHVYSAKKLSSSQE